MLAFLRELKRLWVQENARQVVIDREKAAKVKFLREVCSLRHKHSAACLNVITTDIRAVPTN